MENIELVNFINLSREEKETILIWRNNPLIREWMYNQEEINIENHLSFINSLKTRKDKLYFLVKRNNQNIGVIDFTQIIENKSLHMGIYGNPEIKGVGKILLNEIINYSFNILKVEEIHSEVFVKNIKAYELYKKFNFKDINIKSVNDKEVYCMELKNENR